MLFRSREEKREEGDKGGQEDERGESTGERQIQPVISSLSVLHRPAHTKRFTELGREEKGEGGDRGDLVEKKESPKGEREPNLQYPFLLGSKITGLTSLSPFGLFFFSTRSPLSPPPFSSLPNSVNLFVCSRRWRTLRELITGWICLSPFDSPLYPPGHLCRLPPSSLLCITP